MEQIDMLTKKNINTTVAFAIWLVLCFPILGCATSLDKLNKIAQDALIDKEVREVEVSILNSRYEGADGDTIISVFGKPRKISYEPYPYSLDPNCRGSHCEGDFSDEIWFYTFKRKLRRAKEFYSMYIYFKEGKVVRIR